MKLFPALTALTLIACQTKDQAEESAAPQETGADTQETGETAPTGCSPRQEGWITDQEVYAVPATPTLASSGDTIVDETFGATILRVTDAETDPTMCLHSYSYWPTLNADSSRLLLYCAATGLVLYDFDRESLAIQAKGELFPSKPEGGSTPIWEDVIWSAAEPDLLHAHDGTRLYTYDVSGATYTLMRDFTDELGAQIVLKQMSRSADDDVFAWHLLDYSTAMQGYLVWQASTDTILAFETDQRLDEVQVDKGGEYLVVKTGQQGAGVVEVQVRDLSTGAIDDVLDDGPDYAPGHSDNGHGFIVGHDNWNNRLTWRDLSAPHTVTEVLPFGSDWVLGNHLSLRADDEDWTLLSTYAIDGSDGLYHDELLLVATDGSGAVRRLAHTQSVYGDYWSTPRANLSADGCFVTFTSTWGDTGRTDVFIASLAE